jgi:DNA polymerase-3 subunit delta'
MAESAGPYPEPDRVEGAPHPRDAAALFGQEAAERAVLEAWAAGKLHHAWLLRGPRGIGKATLAYRIARARLAHDDAAAPGLLGGGGAPETLDLPADHPVARRVAAEAEPRLTVVRRALRTKPGSDALETPYRLRTEITVDPIATLAGFLRLTAADGGWRVVILDAADEMNASAANKLLKMLEEPPARTMLLLVAHAPGRLLPTIRSRCRALDLQPLGPEDLARALAQAGAPPGGEAEALAALSGGAPGEALRLIAADGPDPYARLAALLADAPLTDRSRLVRLSETGAARETEPADALAAMTVLLLQRLARAGAGAEPGPEAAPGERALAARLAPDLARARLWAEAAAEAQAAAARARALNLDRAAALLDIWLRIDAAAGRALAGA